MPARLFIRLHDNLINCARIWLRFSRSTRLSDLISVFIGFEHRCRVEGAREVRFLIPSDHSIPLTPFNLEWSNLEWSEVRSKGLTAPQNPKGQSPMWANSPPPSVHAHTVCCRAAKFGRITSLRKVFPRRLRISFLQLQSLVITVSKYVKVVTWSRVFPSIIIVIVALTVDINLVFWALIRMPIFSAATSQLSEVLISSRLVAMMTMSSDYLRLLILLIATLNPPVNPSTAACMAANVGDRRRQNATLSLSSVNMEQVRDHFTEFNICLCPLYNFRRKSTKWGLNHVLRTDSLSLSCPTESNAFYENHQTKEKRLPCPWR